MRRFAWTKFGKLCGDIIVISGDLSRHYKHGKACTHVCPSKMLLSLSSQEKLGLWEPPTRKTIRWPKGGLPAGHEAGGGKIAQRPQSEPTREPRRSNSGSRYKIDPRTTEIGAERHPPTSAKPETKG
ncbi:mannose-6-phosphate isomerase [Striga asiatica]|uniref:Mannose-6-phosphate isomerase n=1 Tax=Striga asiatica TaxID=4170 RepID=A0A5A7QUS9_STRAF|nr:mannose-6-phosphate isomerase [Striga asiatica]